MHLIKEPHYTDRDKKTKLKHKIILFTQEHQKLKMIEYLRQAMCGAASLPS